MFLLFFILLFAVTSAKLITTKFNSMLHGYDIVIQFKDSAKIESFEIDLKQNINYFIREQTKFFPSLNFIQDKTINIEHKQKKVKEFSSVINLYHSEDPLTFFLYQIEKDKHDYNTLSLSFTFDDLKLSLVHQLFFNRIISYKSFTFITSHYQSDSIYFGKFPNEYLIRSLYKGHCSVVAFRPFWGCKLNKVIVGNEFFTYKTNNYASFQTKSKAIKAPSSFFDYLITDPLEGYVKESLCTVENKTKLYCMKNYISFSFPGLNFVFEEMEVKLTAEESFDCYLYSDMCLMIVERGEEDEWEFGVGFLKYFNVSFDYEKENILLFSNTNEIRDTKGFFRDKWEYEDYFEIQNVKLNKGIMMSMMIVLICISILLITEKCLLLIEVLFIM